MEYVGPGRKVYRNYHPSLNGKLVRFWNISANASLQHENVMNMVSFYLLQPVLLAGWDGEQRGFGG